MTTSDKGIALIKEAEGFSPVLYEDQGHPCIGYGCDLSEEEAVQYDGKRITADEADALLRGRVKNAEDAINRLVNPPSPLTQNQFDALVDFVYNVGAGALKTSTLLRELNHGSGHESIADQFLRWNHTGGAINAGLTARRQRERDLFLS